PDLPAAVHEVEIPVLGVVALLLEEREAVAADPRGAQDVEALEHCVPERPLEADLGPVLSDRRGELARLPSLRRAPNARRHPLALRAARERKTEQGPDEDAVRKVGPREPKPLACCGNR